MRDDYESSVAAAFLIGVGLGAIMGVLFAPKAGKDMRRLISRRAAKSADYVSSKSKEWREQAEDLVDKGLKTAEKIADRGKSIADRIV
jgi:gas vesicle protein